MGSRRRRKLVASTPAATSLPPLPAARQGEDSKGEAGRNGSTILYRAYLRCGPDGGSLVIDRIFHIVPLASCQPATSR